MWKKLAEFNFLIIYAASCSATMLVLKLNLNSYKNINSKAKCYLRIQLVQEVCYYEVK